MGLQLKAAKKEIILRSKKEVEAEKLEMKGVKRKVELLTERQAWNKRYGFGCYASGLKNVDGRNKTRAGKYKNKWWLKY